MNKEEIQAMIREALETQNKVTADAQKTKELEEIIAKLKAENEALKLEKADLEPKAKASDEITTKYETLKKEIKTTTTHNGDLIDSKKVSEIVASLF